MIVTGLSSDVLLPAIGVMGLLFTRSRSAAKKSPAADNKPLDTTTEPETPEDAERKALRTANKLRLLSEDEEGFGIDRVPAGVYGFTSSPGEAAPLFRQQIFRSFEMHKHLDGEIHLLGFVTAKQTDRLASRDSQLDIILYPDAFGEAERLVTIHVSRIARVEGPSRDEGNALKLDLALQKDTI